jgi:hypothetical protein
VFVVNKYTSGLCDNKRIDGFSNLSFDTYTPSISFASSLFEGYYGARSICSLNSPGKSKFKYTIP